MTAPVVNSMSVLAKLTADVMGEKKTASRTLTPVAGERPFIPDTGPLPDVGAPFPYEHPSENVVASIRNIRRELNHIEAALTAMETAINVPTPVAVEPAKDIKVAEKAADAKAVDPAFADRFNQLQQDAQAKTFAPDDTVVVYESEADPPKWVCPTHGKAVEKTSARTQKTFIGCPDCNLFER